MSDKFICSYFTRILRLIWSQRDSQLHVLEGFNLRCQHSCLTIQQVSHRVSQQTTELAVYLTSRFRRWNECFLDRGIHLSACIVITSS